MAVVTVKTDVMPARVEGAAQDVADLVVVRRRARGESASDADAAVVLVELVAADVVLRCASTAVRPATAPANKALSIVGAVDGLRKVGAERDVTCVLRSSGQPRRAQRRRKSGRIGRSHRRAPVHCSCVGWALAATPEQWSAASTCWRGNWMASGGDRLRISRWHVAKLALAALTRQSHTQRHAR